MKHYKMRDCYVCGRRHWSWLNRCDDCGADLDRKMATCLTVLGICALCMIAYLASVI